MGSIRTYLQFIRISTFRLRKHLTRQSRIGKICDLQGIRMWVFQLERYGVLLVIQKTGTEIHNDCVAWQW